MKEFKIYKHHTKGYKAVKVGMAWLANPLFNPIWFLFRGLWSFFIIYIILILLVFGVDYELYGELGYFNITNASDIEWIWFGVQFIAIWIPLFKGNDWTANNLIKKGYLFKGHVDALSKKKALVIVLENKRYFNVSTLK